MSDLGRKDFTTQSKEGRTPGSRMDTLEKTKETIIAYDDHAEGSAQPNNSKSAGQSMGDSMRGSKDTAANQGNSAKQSASNQGGSMKQSASNTLGDADDYITSSLGGKLKQ